MFGNRLEPSTREPGYIPAWCAFALSNLYGSLGFIMGGNRFWHPTAQRTRWARETYLRVTIPRITRLCVQSFQALHKNSFSSPKNHPSGRVFFFGFGSYFFWFLGPKSAAVFRPHFLRTRLLNGAKRGPFSGRTFRVHEFAFFSFPARAGGYAEGRSEPLQNRRVWAAVSGHWSAHVSWTWIRWSVPFFIPAVHV